MKKLRRIDIDLMVNELPVMSREEQSSTVGGVLTTSLNENYVGGSDCALQAIAYLSGKSVGKITDSYRDLYISPRLEAGEINPYFTNPIQEGSLTT